MKITNNKSPLIAAMGVAIMSSFSASVSAETNPFGMTELSSGYMQLAEAKPAEAKPAEAKPAEMKCGASMNMGGTAKAAEGACAGAKTPAKAGEGKCGEGKCAAMMEGDKMKKGMEATCGEMMKGKEGKCGSANGKMAEGKCAAQCGEAMQKCPTAKTTEGACGAQMKGCGEAMQGCADMMKGKEGACAATKAAPAAAAPAAPAKH